MGRPPIKELHDRAWLEAEYREKSAAQIAEEQHCSKWIVGQWLRRHGIIRRTVREVRLKQYADGYQNPNKGRPMSATQRDKISRARTGWIPPTDWAERQSKAQRGRTKTAEHQAKINAALRQPDVRAKISAAVSGEKHYNWAGGVGYLPYTTAFKRTLKERIRKRDGQQCRRCSCTEAEHLAMYGRRLEVHHIDYDKTNCAESNLITVCKKCNIAANRNREMWADYYKNLMDSVRGGDRK